MSRVSGFFCTECRTPLQYFPLLATMESARSDGQDVAVTCEHCGSAMRLGDATGGWRTGRWLLGLMPEAALMVAVFFLIQRLLDATNIGAGIAVGLVLSVAAMFLPLVLVFAVMENRFNHRVEAAEPLYGEGDTDETED